jgi:hypothetical protein
MMLTSLFSGAVKNLSNASNKEVSSTSVDEKNNSFINYMKDLKECNTIEITPESLKMRYTATILRARHGDVHGGAT